MEREGDRYTFTLPDGLLVINGDMDSGTFDTDGDVGRYEHDLFWFLWKVIVEEYPFTPIVFHHGAGRVAVSRWPRGAGTGKGEWFWPGPTEMDWQAGVTKPRIYVVDTAKDG